MHFIIRVCWMETAQRVFKGNHLNTTRFYWVRVCGMETSPLRTPIGDYTFSGRSIHDSLKKGKWYYSCLLSLLLFGTVVNDITDDQIRQVYPIVYQVIKW